MGGIWGGRVLPGMLTLLFWLVVGHFIADFPLQSDPMAKGKAQFTTPLFGVPWYIWLSAHCAVHAGAVALITGSVVLGLIEFVAHFFIDTLKSAGFTGIHRDQLLHLLCKSYFALVAFYGVW